MKKIVVLLIFIANVAMAQVKTVSLEECYNNMLITYPLTGQNEIYEKTNQLSLKNIKTAWLPSAELSAQATYQSDAIDVNISAMGNNFGFSADKDQYKATVNINQLIYDWGRIKTAKQLENVNLKVNQQNLQVELNKIKEQINKFYFAILILQRNEEVLGVMQNELEDKLVTVNSGVKNGVLLESDLNALKAEKIRIKQSIIEIRNQRYAAVDILSEISGITLSYDDILTLPEYEMDSLTNSNRPELDLFAYQKEKLSASSNIIGKQNKPTVFAFSQIGYGKPGLNMVSDKFDSFYYLGIGLSWKFWDWNKTSREKQIVLLNKDLISSQESTFNKNINIASANEISKIESYREAIDSDIEIIRLREGITESVRSKFDNGAITSTEYLTELNKEIQAKINYETHKIQLVQSKVNYLYIKGEI